MRALDLLGQRFGRLAVIERAPSERDASGRLRTYWRCQCDCGTLTVVMTDSLRAGLTISCGCAQREAVSLASTTHGHTRGARGATTSTREYRAWSHAKGRCFNPKDPKFYCYGARGITMCERWRHDFAAFFADMGTARPGQTLHRIDNDGNYEPGNCCWTTNRVQARARTDNVYVEWEGQRLVLTDLAALLGISYKALHKAVRMRGENLHAAVERLKGRPSSLSQGDLGRGGSR